MTDLLDEQLAELKRLSTEKPRRFQPGARDAALEEVKEILPRAWVRVLQIADGIQADQFESILTTLEIPGAGEMVGFGDQQPEYEGKYAYIAQTMGGEFTALDLTAVTPEGDCPVILFEDDGESVSQRWPSVGAYLKDLNEDIRNAD